LIGSHYARAAGEDRKVVRAIRDHYRPRTPGDRVPRSTLGALVGAADRIDTICGCFLAGFTPTGSQDPYGLRRQANGLIRVIHDEHGVRLDALVDRAVELYAEMGLAGEAESTARESLVEFFKTRCEAYLRDNGIAYDIANAVKPLSWIQPGLALDRSREIARLRGDSRFERLITGVKRVGNILAPERRLMGMDWASIHAALDGGTDLADGVGFREDRFADAAEGALLAALRRVAPELAQAEDRQEFARVLDGLSSLADTIDAYFDTVLVNCDDERLRKNRHGFLAVAYALFSRYADFSAIVEAGDTAGPS
jgi:glycyl-tRNA synthetase beta chain